MKTKAFFDKLTFTLTYVVWDETSKDAVVIDPVLNYDSASSTYSYESADEVENFVRQEKLRIHYLLETHAHADHLSGSPALKERFPEAKIGIGKKINEVQKTFRPIFGLEEDFPVDGSQFDRLFEDEETIEAGSLKIKVLFTPGHTPACSSYLIGDAVFTGDALFMPDYGVGRCDFPKGDAKTLYHSVTQRLYTLPEKTRVFVGHDYLPEGRELRYESTIEEEKKKNIHLPANRSEEDFVRFRKERDATLSAPRLLLPSIQVNINGGNLPSKERDGNRYLKIPLRERKQ